MIYEFKDNAIYLYQEEGAFLVQPFNPVTGKAFKNSDEAKKWLEEYIIGSHDAKLSTASMNIILENEDVVEIKPGQAPEISSEEAFKVSISLEDEIDSEDLILIIKGENTNKEYKMKVSEGSASRTLLIDEAGDYRLEVKLTYNTDNDKKIIIHKKDDFSIKIV